MDGLPAHVEEELVRRLTERLREPAYFSDLLRATRDRPYRAVLLAWSEIRSRHHLERDEHGRYWLAGETAHTPGTSVGRERRE
jgi:hypothetical protein